MSRLKVFRNGQLIHELEISTDKEWTIGRSSSCDLVLDGEKEISRQHLKLSYSAGQWLVEVLSRYGTLFVEREKVSQVFLNHGSTFDVPPFHFEFEEKSPSAELASTENPEAAATDERVSESSHDMEHTYVGNFSMVPYLRVCDDNQKVIHQFRLDGHRWTVGRDSGCDLCIDNAKFSRRHFEIRNEEGVYLVRDLQSSNGTLLNGEALLPQQDAPIRSGDRLMVVDWTLYFEIRDSRYEEKLKELPVELLNPMIYQNPVDPEIPYAEPTVSRKKQKPAPKKMNWVRLMTGLIVIGGTVAYLMEDEPGAQAPAPQAVKKGTTPFDKLTPQQQQYVRDSYRLADRLFKEGRYENARQEVAKIHQLLPQYEESKQLEKLAEVAIQTQLDQKRAEAQEIERQEMEEKIRRTIVQCRKKINSVVTMQMMDDCLMPVIAFNPEHPDILALKEQVERITAERLAREERQTEYQSLVRKQKILFDKALNLDLSGKSLEAIVAYGDVVSSKLPDPQDYKGRARRKIASIQNQLTLKQGQLEKTANEAFKKGDLKNAILTLKKAIDINPENETLKGRVNSMMGDLKKQMQVLYQEGVLEESVGEVDTAKTKWKKIIDLSVPDEDYYKKARSKLKKYEAE